MTFTQVKYYGNIKLSEYQEPMLKFPGSNGKKQRHLIKVMKVINHKNNREDFFIKRSISIFDNL